MIKFVICTIVPVIGRQNSTSAFLIFLCANHSIRFAIAGNSDIFICVNEVVGLQSRSINLNGLSEKLFDNVILGKNSTIFCRLRECLSLQLVQHCVTTNVTRSLSEACAAIPPPIAQ